MFAFGFKLRQLMCETIIVSIYFLTASFFCPYSLGAVIDEAGLLVSKSLPLTL